MNRVWYTRLELWLEKADKLHYTVIECRCGEECKMPTKWDCTAYTAFSNGVIVGKFNILTHNGWLKP